MFNTNTALSLALVVSASIVNAAPPIARATGSANSSSSGAYQLIADYSGASFFDHFTTYTGPDPTNGHVNYTDMAFAVQNKLLGYVWNTDTNKSSAYIGVDHTNQAPNGRNSVRLISKQTFNAGSMVVIDTNHIPVGDGLWPAIWLLGSKGNWPASGESDILEYVHETSYNGMTLHTSPGCNIKNATTSFQGRLLNTNCNAGNAATGCSIAAFDQNQVAKTQTKVATAGFKFNKQTGGVYVHDWQPKGITVWMFPHGALPSDLVAGHPKPSTWTQKPLAKFQGDCDFSTAFEAMSVIINIDFCGDWAGKTWDADGAAARTGVATCNEYVANKPKAFEDAYFDIAGVKFYSNNGQKPGSVAPAGYKRHEGDDMPPFPNTTTTTTQRPAFSMNVTGTEVPFPISNGTHNCSTNSNSTHYHHRHLIQREVAAQTSDASSSREGGEVEGWLLGAGMFAVLAFFL